MSKRAGPPLFELLRKQSETPSPAEAARREPRPDASAGVPWTGAGVTRAERSAATLEDEPRHPGEIRVPVTRVYMAVAVTMLLLVAAWTAGHYVGVRAGKAEADRIVGSEPVVPPVASRTEPQVQGTPPNPAQSTPRNPGQARPQPGAAPGGAPPGGAAPDPGTPWVLIAGGQRAADPRTPGSNYLALATLPEGQALDAMDFLASKGLRAVAVPVDSGPRGANNPARYTLISLGLAVPSGQYSSTLQQRREHERLVATLGAEWRRERRGGSDFSQTQWSRYKP